MNAKQRHKLEYLLHQLDDSEIREAAQILAGPKDWAWVPQTPHAVGEPVTFAIIASSISLALLPIMPHRALSLAVAFGGGLSLAIFLVCVRRSAARAYWVGQ